VNILVGDKYSISGLNCGKANLMMFTLVLVGLVFIFSYGFSNVAAASGDVIYVNGSSGNDSWNGLNSSYVDGINGPKATIGNAIGSVNNNGTVYIANGTYNENNINTNMTIIGQSRDGTIINGTNTGTVFIVASGVDVTLSNLCIANGNNGNAGAGVFNNGNLTLLNSSFVDNNATYMMGGGHGGAIYNNYGNVTVEGL
jgi:hypothetical protein